MTNQCQHGQLARVCQICEQAAEIERLTATVAGLRESANLRVRYHAAELADVTAERDEAREEVAALEVDAGRLLEIIRRCAAGIDHLSEIARLWEPDYSTGKDRHGWVLAQDARDDAVAAIHAARKGEDV